jgi:hypothetical protein
MLEDAVVGSSEVEEDFAAAPGEAELDDRFLFMTTLSHSKLTHVGMVVVRTSQGV